MSGARPASAGRAQGHDGRIMTGSSGSPTRRGLFSSRSGWARARTPSPRCRITPTVPIDSSCRRCITSNRWKNPSRSSAWIPLTKGSLFHEVLAEFFRALQQQKMAMATTPTDRGARDSRRYPHARRGKLRRAARAGGRSRMAGRNCGYPYRSAHLGAGARSEHGHGSRGCSSLASACPDAPGRDPNSRREPVTIDGRFILRGSIDLVERKPGTKILRVTDHKTSKNRSERGSIIGHGQQLQPVIYSLAVEAATGCTVESARFSYCTTAGGFTEHNVPINERTPRMGIEALEIIDRAVELGMLPPAPAEKACAICDFLPVCGPNQERRARRKSREQIADLIAFERTTMTPATCRSKPIATRSPRRSTTRSSSKPPPAPAKPPSWSGASCASLKPAAPK